MSAWSNMFLRPTSSIYGTVNSVRNWLYDRSLLTSAVASLPVVSVGNLTAGGNGKTPLTLYFAQAFTAQGFRPVIVSRGYGGRERGPKLVTPADSANEVGDEPLLIAKHGIAPMVIARKRAVAAKYIAEKNIGDLIILDDGLQHRALKRNINVVAIDVSSAEAVYAFRAGVMLPEGRFREPLSAAWPRVDIVVLNHRLPKNAVVYAASILESLKSAIPAEIPVFESYAEIRSVSAFAGGGALPPDLSLVACCALGNPTGFFTTVKTLPNPIVAQCALEDHETFTSGQLTALLKEHSAGAIVCSEKDAVKLPKDLGVPVYVLAVEIEIQNGAELLADLLKKLRRPAR